MAVDQNGFERCFLLELPAEIREQIWIHAVTEWIPSNSPENDQARMLQRHPIRVDRLNKPLPPPITSASRQLRQETLHLYYQHNQFEAWQPFGVDCSQNTFLLWLSSLGEHKTWWLNDVVLLYKDDREFQCSLEEQLDGVLPLEPSTLSYRKELSEYERCFEELGLPRHFGRKRSSKWAAWST